MVDVADDDADDVTEVDTDVDAVDVTDVVADVVIELDTDVDDQMWLRKGEWGFNIVGDDGKYL